MTNTPQMPPPEPLDESERSLARALRNLPGGTPPPELDALILGAARRAVHIPPARRDRRWIIGLSTAATAVLAMGVLLKMHDLGRDAALTPPATEEVAPVELRKTAAQPAAASAPMEAAKDAAPASAAGGPAPAAAPVAADMNTAVAPARSEPEQLKSPPPAEMPPPPPLKEIPPRAFPSSEAAQALKPKAPPPPPVVSSTSTLMSTPAPAAPAPAAAAASAMDERKQAEATEADTAARRDAESRQTSNAVAAYGELSGTVAQEPAAKKSAPTGALQSNEPVPQRSLDKVEVGGARLKAAGTALPAVADDAKLDVADWLARIRARLNSGDRAGATTSLKSFVRAHPDVAMPDDLQALLH